ncbi:MAG: beta-lactamase family protein, partial [Actinobacteria bacterium]|nr:beta-lactamase family protein [Actinomycetota bacterium]
MAGWDGLTGRLVPRPAVAVGFAWLAFVAGAALLPAWAVADVPSSAALDRVGSVLTQRSADQGIPGAVAAIVADGRVVYTHAVDGGSPVGESTPFVIGSSGKSITALAAMQLVDRGVLRLSDPVKRYVPELDLADERAEARITVEQILGHTSGISPLAGGALLRSVGQGTMLDVVGEIEGAELVSSPGAEFHYANANYVLAGLVIERASKLRYADYIERNVFEPLGTECSYTDFSEARENGLATGHRYWFGFTFGHRPTFAQALQPAGYLFSCALDLGKYLAALLNGGLTESGERLISERSLAKLFTPGRPAALGAWADS